VPLMRLSGRARFRCPTTAPPFPQPQHPLCLFGTGRQRGLSRRPLSTHPFPA
jgi:hypothetical protein